MEGLLISYWDTSMADNNVSSHPGEGRILPIDSHPTPLLRGDGGVWRARVQTYDAPFSLHPTTPISLKFNGTPRTEHPSLPAVRVFNDLSTYWFPEAPYAGVKVPATGTSIEIISESAHGTFMHVRVRPSR
jgi:immune inhibitor A